MKSLIKTVLVAVAAFGITMAFCQMSKENKEIQEKVYRVLEQDFLTEDDKDFVKFATDPDECKEGFVWLDDKHRELFKQHFGFDR